MSYRMDYIGDHWENHQALSDINTQIAALGFDAQKEKPSILSVYQITEGFDVYDELRQHLLLSAQVNQQLVVVQFNFRSSIDHESFECRLLDIEAALFAGSHAEGTPISTMSFGRSRGFPDKQGMIQELASKAFGIQKPPEFPPTPSVKKPFFSIKPPSMKRRFGR